MEYIVQSLLFITLFIDPEGEKAAGIINTGMEYMDLTIVLAAALLAFVCVDQLSLFWVKFTKEERESVAAEAETEQNLFKLFLSRRFYIGTTPWSAYLPETDGIGSWRFFLYSVASSCIWFTVLVITGTVLRLAWINTAGRFGPFEFEMIMAVLAAYLSFLIFMVASGKNQSPESGAQK